MQDHLILLFVCALCISCQNQPIDTALVDTPPDTLIVDMRKIAGVGPFGSYGTGYLPFFDSTSEYYVDNPYPDHIQNYRSTSQHIDFKPFVYENYRNGLVTIEELTQVCDLSKIDTNNLPSRQENLINIMRGTVDGVEVFIVDQNGNKDFRDDSIISLDSFDLKAGGELIPVQYTIYNGKEKIIDYSWLNMGYMATPDKIGCNAAEFRLGKIVLDGHEHEIAMSADGEFTYDDPFLYHWSTDGVRKDSLVKNDLIHLREFLRIGAYDYQIDSTNNNGGIVRLVRRYDFMEMTGLQVGMKAPIAAFTTVDSLNKSTDQLLDKRLIVANVSGCTRRSYDLYRKMVEEYRDHANIIGLESDISKPISQYTVDVEYEKNEDIFKKYRNAYSSYECYLIDENNRILEKFKVFEWKKHLPKYFPMH